MSGCASLAPRATLDRADHRRRFAIGAPLLRQFGVRDDPKLRFIQCNSVGECCQALLLEQSLGNGTIHPGTQGIRSSLGNRHVRGVEQRSIYRDGETILGASHTLLYHKYDKCTTHTAVMRHRTLWRFRYGIAAGRDSLAAIYDSLAAANAPQVSATPPIMLEAVVTSEARRLRVTRDPRAVPDLLRVASRWYVETEDGLRIAVIDLGVQATVHLSPHVSAEERKALRLIGAFLATSP